MNESWIDRLKRFWRERIVIRRTQVQIWRDDIPNTKWYGVASVEAVNYRIVYLPKPLCYPVRYYTLTRLYVTNRFFRVLMWSALKYNAFVAWWNEHGGGCR